MFSSSTKTQRWDCHVCGKRLCSKRSRDEHMNIHSHERPFRCGDCNYAAASQMTLTRHRQRRHMPREKWHYQCPYCAEPYMEPASYSQHVMARHYGSSATFGCPYGDCPFKCKSSKAFRDHLQKHQAVIDIRANGAQVQKFNSNKLFLYMVDDDYGIGNATMPAKFADRSKLNGFAKSGSYLQQIQQQQRCGKAVMLTMNNGSELFSNRTQKEAVMRINVDELLDNNVAVNRQNKNQWPNEQRQWANDRTVISNGHTVREEVIGRALDEIFEQSHHDWAVETEVVIDDQSMDPQMNDVETDDFGLD